MLHQLQSLVTSWCPWHKAGQTCDDNSSDCLASLPQHSWWMLCCWQHGSMASSSGHPEPLPPEINSWCNKDSIMRFKNSWLMFPSGKLMGRLKFTERFEMEGRRENNWQNTLSEPCRVQCMCSPLKDVAHQTGISEHLPSGALGDSPIQGTCTAANWAWQKDMTHSAHPALGSDVRGTLASPTDTAGTPDPSAFQGVILHSPRVSGLSLKNSTQCSEQSQEHCLHKQGASSAQRVTSSTGMAICYRPELTLEPPAKPRGALSASSQSAGDPKQDHKAPLHFPLLPTSLHCNYCQPCETAKWQGQREQQGGAGLAACNGGVLPQWHRGCPLGASSVTN